MPSHTSLDAAAQERKARLAQLKSLKRKQPGAEPNASADSEQPSDAVVKVQEPASSSILSGRNYDIDTGGAKLGFENSPATGQDTLELRAGRLAEETQAAAKNEENEDKPLDLFKLQPKKPNWDLKRDLDKKMEVLNTRTENAIARLVRERIENSKKAAAAKAKSNGAAARDVDSEAEEVGMEGDAFVEALRVREQEEQEDERREKEMEEEMNGV